MSGSSRTTFDSLDENKHTDDISERRSRNIKRVILVGIMCAFFLGIGVIIGYFSHPGNSSEGSSDGQSDHDDLDSFNMTQFILDNVDEHRIRETLLNYTGQPRLAGTAQDDVLASIIAQEWKDNGLEEVHLASYDVLLSFPNKSSPNVIQVVNTTSGDVQFETRTDETPLRPDENNTNVVPSFNAYSPAGDVTGDLVYVNYGRIEDFEYLANNRSINLTGMIVIARYGKIFRGDKLRNAERFHAAAVILYSDPSDYNRLDAGEQPYPDSWWLPPTGMQRGTVRAYDGDPQTPLYPAAPDAYRIPVENVTTLPSIPCQAIGYGEAQRFLMILKGEEAPADWRGSLNFTYHIGPGYGSGTDLKVRVVIKNYLEVKPAHNVIGYIKGSEEPDRYVLLGNHHDAWVFGSADPLSGTATLTEITRVFGLMLKQGHRPKRTVVFCSWDAEESGLLGSIEWVEDNLKLLQQRGVAYLNVDIAAESNFTLYVGTSPLLQDLMYSVAKKVPSPVPSEGRTLYDLWMKRPLGTVSAQQNPYVTYSLGSGSDMAAFYQRAGVPCVNFGMTFDWVGIPISTYPLYHSSYETFYFYDTFVDPGFPFTKAVAQMWAIAASDLANAELLPLKVERYSQAVDNFLSSLLKTFEERWRQQNVSVDALQAAVNDFKRATRSFQQTLDSESNNMTNNPLYLRMVNDRLIQLERAFLDTEGLPGRPDQKHVMFAPSQYDSYQDNSFPGIVDTMHKIDRSGSDEWELLKQQVSIGTYIIQSAASTFDDVGL